MSKRSWGHDRVQFGNFYHAFVLWCILTSNVFGIFSRAFVMSSIVLWSFAAILWAWQRRKRRRRWVENSSETLLGQAFFHVAVKRDYESEENITWKYIWNVSGLCVSCACPFWEVGNITNINRFEPNEENMHCFVTFWCEGKQAKLRERERERERERDRNWETQKPSKSFARACHEKNFCKKPLPRVTTHKPTNPPTNTQTHKPTHTEAHKPTNPQTQKPTNL